MAIELPFMKKDKDIKDEPDRSFDAPSSEYLREIKPKERYVFHSDYFKVDNYYVTIMSFFHNMGASDDFGPFWGINMIPSGMDKRVTTINLSQVSRMGEKWIADHQSSAEGVAEMNINSQDMGGSNKNKSNARKTSLDLQVIAEELNNGASYLNVQDRIMVKAPSLEMLDDAVQQIERLYMDRFGSLWAAPYSAEQRQELGNLFAKNSKKRGKGFYYTSAEYAGEYNLVTHGLEDQNGIYVGYMVGDVNNSAVLFAPNDFRHHAVVATDQKNRALGEDKLGGKARMADVWGSKISQCCLLDGGRVVHIILDGADMDKLGPKFDNLTYQIDMNHGDVNMFEMFGDVKDELSIFPAQLEKLTLMAEQAYETTDSDRSVIRGSLQDVATKYYIEQRMWADNAQHNRDKLRVVGIPHKDVPKLEMFVSYLDMEYKAMANKSARDDEKLHAMSVLSTTFRNLLANNGDLFNTTTNGEIDGVQSGRRVLYDFSQLMTRGRGIAMAQLVNIIGFAVQTLKEGDMVIIHGAEDIDKGIRPYIDSQFEQLFRRGGKVVYLYNDIDPLYRDVEFNHFDKADYVVLGNMSQNQVNQYQKLLGQKIPEDLVSLITNKSEARAYIRRDFDNVVFAQDLRVTISKNDNKKPRLRSRRK